MSRPHKPVEGNFSAHHHLIPRQPRQDDQPQLRQVEDSADSPALALGLILIGVAEGVDDSGSAPRRAHACTYDRVCHERENVVSQYLRLAMRSGKICPEG